MAQSTAWRRAIVTCIDAVVDCEDEDIDVAIESPAVAVTDGGRCDGATIGGGGGGGGMRLLSERRGIPAGVSPPPSISIPRWIACACSAEW